MTVDLPPSVDTGATRLTLHQLAEGVLAAEQIAANGDYRLEVSPAGFATRWFAGPDQQRRRIRVEGGELVRESEVAAKREPIACAFDPQAAAVLYVWWQVGAQVLTEIAQSPATVSSEVVLFPEHFDVGTTLDLGEHGKLNLGFSPGDEFCALPYVYAGPWETRTGSFWNAPFGAYRNYDQIRTTGGAAAAKQFLDAAITEMASPAK